MTLSLLAGLTLLAYDFIEAANAAPCAPGIISMEVAAPIDLVNFITAMECNGTGVFDVTWYGRNQIPERIEVSDMKSVSITGHALLDTAPAAANDAGIATGMFFVHGGSTLSLRNLALDGGLSQEGAAISVVNASVVNVFDCNFTNNNASNGGALYIRNSEININGETSFVNNLATSASESNTGGGAIYATETSNVNINGDTSFIDNWSFLDGGAILLLDGSGVYLNGSTDFFNNQAGDDGGAISCSPKTKIHVEGVTTFINNTAADDGGAIKADTSGIEINGSTHFTGNSAGDSGGAISVDEGQGFYIYGGVTFFINNSAAIGGAMKGTNSSIEIQGSTNFTGNSAGDSGGAILVDEGSGFYIYGGVTFFTNNSATIGDVISSLPNTTIFLEGVTIFINSIASADGGAIKGTDSRIEINGSTHFAGNSAGDNGGAVLVDDGSGFYIYGGVTFFTNNSAAIGGAISGKDAEISIDNETSFVNNMATSNINVSTGGGAISAEMSTVNIDGDTRFVNNSAFFDGGAILLDDSSDLYIKGITDFLGNEAGDDGGAIYSLPNTKIYLEGATTFINNTAADDGGAIKGTNSRIEINGSTHFTGNSAGDSGGAIRVDRGPGLYIFDGATFFNNNSALNGGAIHTGGCSLGIDGNITFASNSAVEFGGAIFSTEDDPITLAGNLSFVSNSADIGGGALSLGDPGQLTVSGANFKWNKANVGGAVSVNAVQDLDREFKECQFEYNTANADGGGMYFITSGGADIMRSSIFRGNYAATSGGGVYHREALTLINTTLEGNLAGDEGFAVLGSAAAKLKGVFFVNNTKHCERGYYLFDNTWGEGDKTRFNLACELCPTAEDRDHEDVDVQYPSRIPTCEELPKGAEAVSSGTTVEGLTLEGGYYRTSKESPNVLECHRKSSCVGGNSSSSYCEVGFQGPYCAACAEGYAPLIAYSCRQCSNIGRPSTLGLAVAMVTVLVLVAAALSAHLMRAIEDDVEHTEIARGSLERRCIYLENLFVKAFPLTAVKIVVVVWQIISQFATIAGDVYPEEYATFIAKINFFNLDIGVILSYTCLVSTDFYDHLLLNTIAPLAVLMALVGTYSVAKRRNNTSETAMREVKHKHLSAGLFVAFLVYSSVSFTIFQTFACETLDDGVSYLRADYNITCDTDKYALYRAYAILMVCVYPIGLPAILAWWLLQNRADLKKANRTTTEHLEPFRGIWSPYRPSRYYYEVVECGRRIALTATASFVPPNSVAQIAVVLLVAAVLLFISESMSPFRSSIDMGLYRWGNGIILASMYVALLLKVDPSEEENSTISAFGIVLIAANVFLVITVLIQSMLMAFEFRGRSKSATLVRLSNFRQMP